MYGNGFFAFFPALHLSHACLSCQATAEANNLAAVATAKDQYYKSMEKVGCHVKNQRNHTMVRMENLNMALLFLV